MNIHDLEKLAVSLGTLSELKRIGGLNYINAKSLASNFHKSDLSEQSELLNKIKFISDVFRASGFELPDESIKGPIGLAETENKLYSYRFFK